MNPSFRGRGVSLLLSLFITICFVGCKAQPTEGTVIVTPPPPAVDSTPTVTITGYTDSTVYGTVANPSSDWQVYGWIPREDYWVRLNVCRSCSNNDHAAGKWEMALRKNERIGFVQLEGSYGYPSQRLTDPLAGVTVIPPTFALMTDYRPLPIYQFGGHTWSSASKNIALTDAGLTVTLPAGDTASVMLYDLAPMPVHGLRTWSFGLDGQLPQGIEATIFFRGFYPPEGAGLQIYGGEQVAGRYYVIQGSPTGEFRDSHVATLPLLPSRQAFTWSAGGFSFTTATGDSTTSWNTPHGYSPYGTKAVPATNRFTIRLRRTSADTSRAPSLTLTSFRYTSVE